MALELPRTNDLILRMARAVAGAATRWHRARCDGAHHLPRGAALLVGNHGIYGFEVPVFFYLIHQLTSRVPIGLADRHLFGWRPMRDVLARCGGHIGTVDTALALLEREQLVVCYPGGSRETFKGPGDRYKLRWERASGFVRLAIQAQVPIVPFAGLGVDDTYRNFGYLPGTRALLGRYAAPFAVGLGPLPLPVRLRFRVGEAIAPPRDVRDAPALKATVAASVRALLDGADADGDANAEDDQQDEEQADGEALAPTAAAVL
ncbi:MAG: acyltransferase [Myxococcales bacterium]|nr:acyltransferase [Myxococcales bacterium]